MQEVRYDDTEKLTSYATGKEFIEALTKPGNWSVAMHKPGILITQPSGDQYLVDGTGCWRRIKDIKGREALDLLMTAHKREKDELMAQCAHWEERAHRAEAELSQKGGSTDEIP